MPEFLWDVNESHRKTVWFPKIFQRPPAEHGATAPSRGLPHIPSWCSLIYLKLNVVFAHFIEAYYQPGIKIVDPVVLRPSRSRCAWVASDSG
jgi:hypothetical protein